MKFCFFSLLTALMASAAPPTPVILISIDTLRADHVGSYGYQRVPTPNIDSFAAGGTLFENIECQTPLTLPSHTSLLTSTYPFQTRVQENAEPIPSGIITLAGVLKEHGYKTAAFVSSVFLEREMGLDQGFDTYDSPFDFAAFSPVSGEMFWGGVPRAAYVVRERRAGALTVRAALRWLAANKGQPVFVLVHLFDLHTPYTVPESISKAKGLSRYDAQLALEDEILGRLKTALAQSGLWDKALTVLLSDHGEGLGDHGEGSHGYFIYESTLHVPLLFHWPSGYSAQPATVGEPGGLIDVAPTILGFLKLPAPGSFVGTSLLTHSPHAVYSESLHTHDSFGWAALRSVRSGEYKYIAAPKSELYDLRKDPTERTNLVQSDPARARDFRTQLVKIVSTHAPQTTAPQPNTSPETEKMLASLGYLGHGPQSKGSNADPKDRLPEFKLYEKAIDQVMDRNLNAAVTTLKQVLTQDPTNTLARRDLATCYLDLRDYSNARTNFARVVTAAPNDYPSQFGLGLAAKHLGMLDEARAHLEAACRLAPEATQCQHELETLPQPRQ